MNTQQYYDRKQYIEQVKNSFSDKDQKRNVSYTNDKPQDHTEGKSFFKIRLFFSVVLFFAFVFVQKADINYKEINASNVVKQIQKSVSLPDEFDTIKDAINIE